MRKFSLSVPVTYIIQHFLLQKRKSFRKSGPQIKMNAKNEVYCEGQFFVSHVCVVKGPISWAKNCQSSFFLYVDFFLHFEVKEQCAITVNIILDQLVCLQTFQMLLLFFDDPVFHFVFNFSPKIKLFEDKCPMLLFSINLIFSPQR